MVRQSQTWAPLDVCTLERRVSLAPYDDVLILAAAAAADGLLYGLADRAGHAGVDLAELELEEHSCSSAPVAAELLATLFGA